jgi:hypothetical protein
MAERAHCARVIEQEREQLASKRERERCVKEAVAIAQEAAEAVQRAAHGRIAHVVTRCLKAVFPDSGLEFQIDFRQTRGKTEAQLCFIKDGNLIDDPTEEVGGGTIDVAAFALRLACLMISTPRKRRFLCLDECWKGIHGKENRERAAELMLTISEEMEVQVLLMTGLDWLKVGKVIELEGD